MPLLDRLRGLFRGKAYSPPIGGTGGWFPIIREPFTGAWQRNIELNPALASTYYADFSCRTLIANDIAKLGVKLMRRDSDGIWVEVDNPAFSPVLRKPNHYQTDRQFWESWILSKLGRGNTYVLKERDNRRVVTALYVLDPQRVTPLIADDGSVFYQLATDGLSGLPSQVTVPATEIIHDRMNTIFAACPLIGAPPIYAGALAAIQGLNIQNQSARLFANNAQPGGVLTAPGHIEEDTVERLKTTWEHKYGGNNIGRLAILGDGLKFEKMSFTAVEGQLIEQLGWTDKVICSVYHVPAYKIGVGDRPAYNTAQLQNEEYYSQCIQTLIENAEACLDEGLGLGSQYGLRTEFDTDNLLRMDTAAQADTIARLVGGGIMTPNEGRKRFNLPPKTGGDTVYLQHQDYSIEALAKRDGQDDPFGTTKPAASPPQSVANDDDALDDADAKSLAGWRLEKAVGTLMELSQ